MFQNLPAQNRATTVSSTRIHSVSARAKHVLGNHVVVVDAFAGFVGNYGNFGLVQNIRPRLVRVPPLAPANYGAKTDRS